MAEGPRMLLSCMVKENETVDYDSIISGNDNAQ